MKTFLTSFIILFSFLCSAQVTTKSIPEENRQPQIFKNKIIPKFSISNKMNKNKLLEEDIQEAKQGLPFRFGVPIDVDLGLGNGLWETSKDGRTWYLELSSEDAFSINLQFDKFNLADGAELFIYSKDGSMQMGPFTARENNKSNKIATDLIKGSSIVIKLFEPKSVSGKSILHISKLIHGYKNMFQEYSIGGFGLSNPCQKNVRCPEGAGWEMEKTSVAMIVLGNGDRICSGSLINNTCQDLKTYFLTAFHCLDFNNDNWIFRFNYESPTCSNQDGYSFQSLYGSTLKASWSTTDFALLELNQLPGGNSEINYAGWSRSASGAANSAGIHHPRGDVKKISIDNDMAISNSSVINWNVGSPSPIGTHWETGFDIGGVEPGSSGSPLFNQDHLITGQLHGGNGPCPGSGVHQFYGRFDISWDGGGTQQTRLKDWLDPLNTQAMTLSTIKPLKITGPENVCGPTTFILENTNSGIISVLWSTTPDLTITGSNTGSSIVVSRTNPTASPSTGVISAQITTSCGTKTIQLVIISGQKWDNGFIMAPTGTTWCDLGGEMKTFEIQPHPEATSYTWSVSPTSSYQWILPADYNALVGIANPGYYTLSVTAHTPCGDVTRDINLEVNESCGPSYFRYYPNPANNELTITDEQPNSASEKKSYNTKSKTPFSIKLYNKEGKVLRDAKVQPNSSSININTSNIPNGTYFLHITRGKETQKKQVIIKH